MRMVFMVNEFGRYDLDGGQWAILPRSGGAHRVMFHTGLDTGQWEFVADRDSLPEAARYIWQAIQSGAPARFTGTLPDSG